MNVVNFALVGCGRISEKHIDALSKIKRGRIIEVFDKDAALSEKISRKIKANLFKNENDLFKKSDSDCFIITSPNGLHKSQSIKALRKGFDVIVEKPMALNYRDVLKMYETSAEFKRKLYSVFQLRHAKTIMRVKNAIERKKLGKILFFSINQIITRPQKYFDESRWRGTERMDGGTLLNQAIHYIDLVDWFFGSVNKVNSFSKRLSRNIETEDSSVINFEMVSGAIGSMSFTVLASPSNLETSFTIVGEKGTIKLEGSALEKVIRWSIGNTKNIEINKNENEMKSDHHKFYEEMIKNYYGEKSHFDHSLPYRANAIIDAIYKSAKRNGVVKVNY